MEFPICCLIRSVHRQTLAIHHAVAVTEQRHLPEASSRSLWPEVIYTVLSLSEHTDNLLVICGLRCKQNVITV